MLKVGDKTFLNLQEAVAWLMENNCIPFQCTAPYAAETEIGMGTIVNPSPAKVRIGSIIFFSDSKVSTVTGITQNGFIVSDKYNDLVDDVVYVSNVAINDSGHLIVTLSNDEQIDAGIIKQVTGFDINASQHLIARFNDSTSIDLGAIFSGDVNISGNLTATHAKLFENIEDSLGHKRFIEGDVTVNPPEGVVINYKKWSLSGSHLMIVVSGSVANGTNFGWLADFAACVGLPQWLVDKVVPFSGDYVDVKEIEALDSDWGTQNIKSYLRKTASGLRVTLRGTTFTADRTFRIQFDLLIDNA